jgi:hypothetical protein
LLLRAKYLFVTATLAMVTTHRERSYFGGHEERGVRATARHEHIQAVFPVCFERHLWFFIGLRHGRRVTAPDRLGVAWEAFVRLSAADRRAFLAMLREWHLARRIDVLAARGRTYAHRPPQSLAGISLGEMASAADDDLKNLTW